MRMSASVAAIIGSLSGACSIIPSLPPDFALPVQDILLHTACELQEALISLDTPEFKRFKARQWSIAVSLQPRVDTGLNVSGGWTRKNPFLGNPTTFTTWAISAPGLLFDVKAWRSGGVSFNFKSSAALMNDKRLPCDVSTPSYHALAQHLGVGSWLRRTAAAINIASTAEIDKPTFTSDITIKLAANGSYTFTFPPGTDLAAFGGSYTLDEQLLISMTALPPTPKPITVVTLPHGDNFGDPKRVTVEVPTTFAVESAKQRLDAIQLEQAIRNLQIRPQ
jgi:hypothetical protein